MLGREDLLVKEEVTFYYPLGLDEDDLEVFTIRLLDVLDSYLFPLITGLSRRDVDDFCKHCGDWDFDEYLLKKRFVSRERDLVDLVAEYVGEDEVVGCLRITIGRPITATSVAVDDYVRKIASGGGRCEQGVLSFMTGILDVDKGRFDLVGKRGVSGERI